MGNHAEKQCLVAELSHQINSPLAAIRNAIYLAAGRSQDPVLHQYLKLADEEISIITAILRQTRALVENGCLLPSEAAPVVESEVQAARNAERAAA